MLHKLVNEVDVLLQQLNSYRGRLHSVADNIGCPFLPQTQASSPTTPKSGDANLSFVSAMNDRLADLGQELSFLRNVVERFEAVTGLEHQPVSAVKNIHG